MRREFSAVAGRTLAGVAWCPRCMRDVYLASADVSPPVEAIGVESVARPVSIPDTRPYQLAHHASRWPCAGWDEHTWLASGFEVRRITALEVTDLRDFHRHRRIRG